jgi:ferredoxin
MSSKKKTGARIAQVDGEKCTLCEACIRICPNSAYRVDRKGKTVRLVFKPEACDGCPEGVSCVVKCPETAISFKRRTKATPTKEQVAAESKLLQCAYCGEHFSSSDRVETVAKRLSGEREIERSYCPLCRRTRLVVNLIETRRKPGAKAEYRSGKDILRRAEERKAKKAKKTKKAKKKS